MPTPDQIAFAQEMSEIATRLAAHTLAEHDVKKVTAFLNAHNNVRGEAQNYDVLMAIATILAHQARSFAHDRKIPLGPATTIVAALVSIVTASLNAPDETTPSPGELH